MKNKVLGVVGGAGPLASAEFTKTIYEFSLGEREQEAPIVLLYSIPLSLTGQRRCWPAIMNRHSKARRRIGEWLRDSGALKKPICRLPCTTC